MPLLMIGSAILSGLAVQGKVTGMFESYPLSANKQTPLFF